MSETIEVGGGVRAVVGRTWVICQEHRKTVDDYSRAFPPAMETAEKASLFLIMMGDGEALQASPTIKCPACAIGRDRIEDADYACLRAVRCALPPDAVPLDIVVRVYSWKDGSAPDETPLPGYASVREYPEAGRYDLTLVLSDHRENVLSPIKLSAFRDGPSRMGKHLRFTLTPIARSLEHGYPPEYRPVAWKLSPSLNVPGVVRAFITLVEDEE